MHRNVPKDVLPEEYGGTAGPFDNTDWREQLLKESDYFDRLEAFNQSDSHSGPPDGARTIDEAADFEDSNIGEDDAGDLNEYFKCESGDGKYLDAKTYAQDEVKLQSDLEDVREKDVEEVK